MTRKNYFIIPVLAAIVMIPQFLFWWLAPVTAVPYLAVYIGGTLLTIGISVVYLMTYWNSNLRKTVGLSVVCSILEISVIILSVVLLVFNASVRSAVFAYIINALVCLIVLVPLITASIKPQRQGIYPDETSAEPTIRPMSEMRVHNYHIPDVPSHLQSSSHITQHSQTRKPLPPRNR